MNLLNVFYVSDLGVNLLSAFLIAVINANLDKVYRINSVIR
jgi:hypothetical protein